MVWFGQVVSLVGSSMTGFGLGVWVFQKTGSATQFAMIGLAAIVPSILLASVAGVYVDRWDRRRTMMFSDFIAGLSTVAVAILLYFGKLELWHILITTSVSSGASVFQRPAYTAATTLMVPKEQLGRAAGMMQIAGPLGTILAPILAGALIVMIGLSGIIVIDFSTFLFAMATMTLVRFPAPEKKPSTERPSVRREAAEGWHYVRQRPGLLYIMGYFMVFNFVFSFAGALYAPLVLSFSGAVGLGTVMSLAGAGGIVGSVVLSVWGGPKKRILALLTGGLLVSLCMSLTGVRASVPLMAGASFMMMALLPFLNGASQTIWQTKTDPTIQGRVFAMRSMAAMGAVPLAYVLAGPLADKVFEPRMVQGGALATVFGPLMGVGPGRGIGLMFVLTGLLAAVLSVCAFAVPRLRNVETEVPDAI